MIFVHAGYPDANSDPAGFGGQYPLHTGATVPWYRYEGKVWYGMVWFGGQYPLHFGNTVPWYR